MSLGKAIARCRERKQWKQIDLARELGVHPSHVTRWEGEKVRPRLPTLKKIALALDVTVDELMLSGIDQNGQGLGSKLGLEDDLELVELVQQLNKLEQVQRDALKTVLRDMLTRSQLQQMLQK